MRVEITYELFVVAGKNKLPEGRHRIETVHLDSNRGNVDLDQLAKVELSELLDKNFDDFKIISLKEI